MKTFSKPGRLASIGAAGALAMAALGFAGAAQARDNVYWSVGVGTPGAVVSVGNVGSVYQQPVYPQPVYVQPQPVYVQPRPVYVQPEPVYYEQPQRYYNSSPVYVRPAPVYVAPQPIYYERPYNQWRGHGYRGHHGDRYGQTYAPVQYQRDPRDFYRYEDRR